MATGSTQRVHRLQPGTDVGVNYQFRLDALRPWVEGRSVLDIGAVRSFRNLHAEITKIASRCVAIDLDENGVQAMRDVGFDARVADAQDLSLNETFDVVFAGELIEHLDDLSGFGRSVRSVLSDGGHLVVTTPNPFAISNFVYRIGDSQPPVNDDHMMWFCETTLQQLMTRLDFNVVEIGFLSRHTPNRLRRVGARLSRTLLPQRLTERTLICVAQPNSGGAA